MTTVSEHVIGYISFAGLIALYWLDQSTLSTDVSSRLLLIRRLAFHSKRRTFWAYFIVMSGILIDAVLNSWMLTSALPWILLVYVLVLLAIAGLSLTAARLRERKLDTAIRRTQEDDGCFQELVSKLQNRPHTEDAGRQLKLVLQEGFGLLETVEMSAEANLSEECTDRMLWSGFFDKFEKREERPSWIRWWFRRAYDCYWSDKRYLIDRDDELGHRFRSSLMRWRRNRT
jgi:hypothetical protein